MNPSFLFNPRDTLVKNERIEECVSEKDTMGLLVRPVVGCILLTACKKHVKGAIRDPKSHQCVHSTYQGWPKPREGHGHGVPVVVKLVNGQITAKGDRSFYPEQKGGTADA